MIFYYLREDHIFALWSSMWLAHKLVYIKTPIGYEELDPIQLTINHPSLEAEDPSSSLDLGTIQDKNPHQY